MRQPQLPVKVKVSATAFFENSRNEKLSKEAILLSKNLLKENILKLEKGQETKRRIKKGL